MPAGLLVTVPGPVFETLRVNDEAGAMVKDSALERLASGLATVTWAVPAVAISAAVIAAVNWVALTNVVVRALPFQRTLAPLTKFEPVAAA